ncbi:glycosyltransferase family 4 protein [Halomonas sp. NPDC076908]|uniref:glycosyltransferase family 4 protein n=1 Tax=Halomonas sp. NPDC076908 TaxID=3390567 RepID=UPI003CFF10EF
MHIIHVNLAKGFRGGERQTVLLIQAIAGLGGGTRQTLVCQPSSPLRRELADTPGVVFINARHQLEGHWKAGTADSVHAHEAKAVHWAWLHQRLYRTPYIITRRVDTPIKRKWSNTVFYRNACYCVAISNAIAEQLKSFTTSTIPIIPSAYSGSQVNPEIAAEFRKQYAGKTIVGHVGALVDRHKGQRVLIEAAKRLEHKCPTCLFVFFGRGEDEAVLKKESASISNIIWAGFKDNINDYLPGLDIFAFPSRNEGLGSVLLDVMQAGVPIIASNVGGIPDIIKHGENGFLIAVDSDSEIEHWILELKDNVSLRASVVNQARSSLSFYSKDMMANRYMALYVDMVEKQTCR